MSAAAGATEARSFSWWCCWYAPLQVGSVLQQHFKGQAAELIAAAQQSAVALVQLVASHFPGFRDHCIYKGRQVS